MVTENSLHLPFISVVLPLRNEAYHIEKGLNALLSQDYPADRVEILIVDGMSTDNTGQIVRHFAALHPELEIYLLENPHKIVATGLNLAICQAKGEIIIRVDGHTVIAPDYVRQCVYALRHTQAENVGGKMNAAGDNLFGKAVAFATSTPFGIGGARFHYSDQEEWVDTVYMGAWPRRVFEKVGLFDEELVRDQDDEFNYRLRKQGGRILLSPAIRSEYKVRSSPRALWQQYYQYGYWKVRVLQKHPLQMRLRQFAPPAFVLSLIFSILLALLFVPGFPSSIIPALYLIANLLASIWVAARRGWSSFFLLPLCFAILHISYGLGFLIGLLKFINRWGDQQGQTPVLVRKDA